MANPKGAVKSLKIERDGKLFTASWSDPAKSVYKTWSYLRWVWETNGNLDVTYDKPKTGTTEATSEGHVSRADFYPCVDADGLTLPTLDGVTFHAIGYTWKKKRKGTNDATDSKVTFALQVPADPQLDDLELDDDTAKIQCKVEVKTEDDAAIERYDTQYRLTRTKYDSETGTTTVTDVTADVEVLYDNTATAIKPGGTMMEVYDQSTAYTKATLSYADADVSGISDGDFVFLDWDVWSRGFAGDGQHTTARYVIAYPATPSVGSYVTDYAHNVVRVGCASNATETAPVSKMALQYVLTTATPTASTKPDEEEFAAAGPNATMMGGSIASIELEQGQSMWFRVESTSPSGQTQVSSWVKGMSSDTPIEESGTVVTSVACAVSPVEGSSDSLEATATWTDDAYNGTTISYSTDYNAWHSTKEPETFDMLDSDYKSSTENKASIYLAELDENTLYYVRARRYNSETDAHGSWSPIAQAVTGASAAGVSITMDSAIADGEPLDVAWSVGGDNAQTSYTVYLDGEAIAHGEGSTSSYTVQADALSGLSSATITVGVTTVGSEEYTSSADVAIWPEPTATVTMGGTIATKPVTATVTADAGTSCDVRLVACGVSDWLPSGANVQYAGDVMWSGTVTGTATLSIDADLIDGAQYELRVTPTAHGLTGDTATAKATVEWAHQAVEPTATVTTDVDEDGVTATIVTTAPEGAAATDVCDVYRMTRDGNTLIASGVAFGATVNDQWAPYGTDECGYVVCTRTAEGDQAWDDVTTDTDCELMWLDWTGGSVALAYDLSIADKWTKDVTVQTYLDGTTAAWYGGWSTRTATVSADVVSTDTDTDASLRDLANHAGNVMVRTPDGLAFEASVSVDGVTRDATSRTTAVSLTISEVTHTGEFMAVVEDA